MNGKTCLQGAILLRSPNLATNNYCVVVIITFDDLNVSPALAAFKTYNSSAPVVRLPRPSCKGQSGFAMSKIR
jgi:hypothetical protein